MGLGLGGTLTDITLPYVKTRRTSAIQNSNGSVLMSLLVVAVVTIVGIMVLGDYYVNASNNARFVEKKVELANLEKIMNYKLNDSALCTHFLAETSYNVTNPVSFQMSSVGTGHPVTFDFDRIPATTTSTYDAGSFLWKRNSDPDSEIVNMQLQITDPLPANAFKGVFKFEFRSHDSMIQAKPMEIATILQTDGAPNAKITGCGSLSSSTEPPSGFKIFLKSGTFIVPDGVNEIFVEAWGGGGGGAVGYYRENNVPVFRYRRLGYQFVVTATQGKSGGGGGYAAGLIRVTPGSSFQVLVGKGGDGNASTNGSLNPSCGQDGGTSVFGNSLIGAYGGRGGCSHYSSNGACNYSSWNSGMPRGQAGSGFGSKATRTNSGMMTGECSGLTGAAAGSGGQGSVASGYMTPSRGDNGRDGRVAVYWGN